MHPPPRGWRPGRWVQSLLLLIPIIALPLVLNHKLWEEGCYGTRSNAWDGAGHHSIADIYSQTIFPDTFGWTHAYFAGMPFPNFYPPLFFWLVALLANTHLISAAVALKVVTVLPVLIMPAALWLLGYYVSDRSRLTATAVALGGAALMSDARFSAAFPAGLDYFSTFQIGLYTQPLGFVLLIAWFVSYTGEDKSRRRFVLASILLALTILANFFNAVAASLFIASTLIDDWLRLRGSSELKERGERSLLVHLGSPLVAACLTLFWTVPMLASYSYLVTRPTILPAVAILTPALVGWYVVALAGAAAWLSRPTRAARPYLMTCAALGVMVGFGAIISPDWFPLQSARFLATLNFLLAVPVGHALAFAIRLLSRLLGETTHRRPQLEFGRARYTTGIVLTTLLLAIVSSPGARQTRAFYPEAEIVDVDAVLRFARHHRGGRYLVEVVNPWDTRVAFDARAMNSYLGAQGNETLSAVFHEASPMAIFTLPVVNAFSQYPDSFGISSVLSDDIDFHEQPIAAHIKRAQALGVRYLVIHTSAMKQRLANESGAVGERHDFGGWSIFELRGGSEHHARVLRYRPALVVSSFTLKQRKRNETGFVRLVEEQFADNWLDVLLVRSSETRLDRLSDLSDFGALIVGEYDYTDEDRAFDQLRALAQQRSLILFSSESPLFRRVRGAQDEFPHLTIIERQNEEAGEKVDSLRPSFRYNETPRRQEWVALRRALEAGKVAVGAASSEVSSRILGNSMEVRFNSNSKDRIPVLIATTFHPNWQRNDGKRIYAATPFYMLTFTGETVHLEFKRRWFERVSVWASASAIGLLGIFIGWSSRKR